MTLTANDFYLIRRSMVLIHKISLLTKGIATIWSIKIF